MNGHLRRCRCASAPHVPTAYAPVRCSRRLASDAFLHRLQYLNTRTGSYRENRGRSPVIQTRGRPYSIRSSNGLEAEA